MQVHRRALLAAALGLLIPASTAAQTIERRYWPTEQWRRATPERRTMDHALLALVDERIRSALPDVTGVVVVRNGYIEYEQYYGGVYGRNDPIKIRSVTKSVTGALIGIALAEGALTSLDQSIGEIIPDRIPANADPRTSEITVRQLLTMTSGWQWDIDTDYPRLIASDDWAAYTLSQPVVFEPGTFYAYNSGGSHVLSLVISAATGQDTADFAQERLFTPLGIARPTWQRSPQDEAVGGFGLELTPRNMAKFGYLFLNRGRWDDQQIVPADYVDAATSYQSDGDSTGYAWYGFQWWVTESYGAPAYFALGFGSQYIFVVPSRDLVVVVVKGFDDPPPVVTPSRAWIEELIVPAAPVVDPVG